MPRINVFKVIERIGKAMDSRIGSIPDIVVGWGTAIIAAICALGTLLLWTYAGSTETQMLPSTILGLVLLTAILLSAAFVFGSLAWTIFDTSRNFPSWYGYSLFGSGILMVAAIIVFFTMPWDLVSRSLDASVLAARNTHQVSITLQPVPTATRALPVASATTSVVSTPVAGANRLPTHTCPNGSAKQPAILINTSDYPEWNGREVCAFPFDPYRNGGWRIYFLTTGQGQAYPLAKSSTLRVDNGTSDGLMLGYDDVQKLATMLGYGTLVVPTPMPIPTSSSPTGIFLPGDDDNKVFTAEDRVRLRKAPGFNGKAIAAIPIATRLIVTGKPVVADGIEWVPVQLDGGADGQPAGTRGWVALDLLVLYLGG